MGVRQREEAQLLPLLEQLHRCIDQPPPRLPLGPLQLSARLPALKPFLEPKVELPLNPWQKLHLEHGQQRPAQDTPPLDLRW